jgi:hypothetical protein
MEMSENRKVRKNSDARIFRRKAKIGKGTGFVGVSVKPCKK